MNSSVNVDESGMVYGCPVCGEDIETVAMDQDVRTVYPVEEMWPGGPLFEDTGAMGKLVKDGPQKTTFGPCGHVVVGTYTLTGHKRADA